MRKAARLRSGFAVGLVAMLMSAALVPSAQAASPAFRVSPGSLAFGKVSLDTKVFKSIQITNTTKVPQRIDSSSTGPEFYLIADLPALGSTTCTYAPGGGIQVKAGGTCAASVYFNGQGRQPGSFSRSLSIFPAGSPGMARTIRVTASVPYPYSVTPTDGLDYGDVTAGTFPVTDSVTIKNTSGTGLDLSLSLVGSDLSSFDNVDFVGSTCGTHTSTGFTPNVTLAADASCRLTIALSSEVYGDHSFSFGVSVQKSIGASTTYDPLGSIPVTYRSVPPSFTVSPNSVKFGNVDVGSTSPTKTITLKNTSQADEYFALDVGGFQSTGVYQDTSKCDGPIAPGKTCKVTVSLTPNLGGSQVGVLTFTVLDAGGDVVPGASTEIPADITGTAPNFTVSPTTVRFGNVNIGDSPFKEVEVKNTSKSDQDVRINSDSLPPGVILDAGSSRCDIGIPRTLEPGTSCLLYVRFTPQTIGAVTGYLFVDLLDDAGSQIPGTLKGITITGTARQGDI